MEGENRMTRTKNVTERQWDHMKSDMLVKIFTTFHVMDLIMNVSRVCRSWHSACADPSIWKVETLDLSVIGRYFSIPPTVAATWKDECSSRTYTRILRDAFDLSGGTITKLIFHFQIHIKDEHLNLVADGCPRLKHLVLPQWHGLSLDALQRCFSVWGSTLESLMVPNIDSPNELPVKLIGENCPNLKELKFMSELDEHLAASIVTFLPRLKVLSIRGTTIRKKALEYLMNEMQNLEVLNITHSLIIHWPPLSHVICYCSDVDSIIKKEIRHPAQFLSCHINMCTICRAKYWDGDCDELDLCWCDYREDVWRVDEISSLSY